LINTRGELVGINTGIFSQSGGYQGIGFAIPSKLARHVVDELMKNGEVRRGAIGYLKVDNLTSQLAEDVHAPNTQGAIIVEMQRNSPPFEAGLKPGDVIVGFNGQPVNDAPQFNRMVGDAKIGTTATLKVMREGRPLAIRIAVVSSGR
jgi:serine protease Do